jgi:hypothetical protein
MRINTKTAPQYLKMFARCLSAVVIALVIFFGTSTGVQAAESDAKQILKSMSDYMAAQKSLSFEYDATLEIITTEDQKLALASSGTVTLNRPDKIRATRSGGFADVEMSFDGKALTILGKNLNLYTQLDVPGTIDHLVNELHETYNRPLPAADLLLSNSYDDLMAGVIDIKDLGSGVIGGVECDYLAFRTKDVDWQIWIGQGKHPYPYRYVVTSKDISGGPQYTVQLRDWKSGGEVAATDFSFKNPTKADKVELKDLKGTGDLPDHFRKGEAK